MHLWRLRARVSECALPSVLRRVHGTERMVSGVNELAARIRSEAELADRPGQHDRLNQIALDVEQALESIAAEARWFRRQADYHIGRANRLEQHPPVVVWDECAGVAEDLGWLHDFAADDARARNPYRQEVDA